MNTLTGDIVLLVDDAPQSLASLCQELEGDGYSVLVAPSGDAALERLELVTPDAILLDAVMPGLSGFDVCRRVKADPARMHVPVIFMTGLAETEHVLEAFAAGGVDYVVKPVRAEVLARLAAHVRNARAVRLAQEALDVGGNGVVVTDRHGRIAWHSPMARRWIEQYGVQPAAWATGDAEAERVLGVSGEQELLARAVGAAAPGESMWLLCERRRDVAPSRLARAALTPREAEVLSWVAKGKTNRDVGEILGMSPRTVNKHLEHVYEKLGVETRAAAALASRGDWSDSRS